MPDDNPPPPADELPAIPIDSSDTLWRPFLVRGDPNEKAHLVDLRSEHLATLLNKMTPSQLESVLGPYTKRLEDDLERIRNERWETNRALSKLLGGDGRDYALFKELQHTRDGLLEAAASRRKRNLAMDLEMRDLREVLESERSARAEAERERDLLAARLAGLVTRVDRLVAAAGEWCQEEYGQESRRTTEVEEELNAAWQAMTRPATASPPAPSLPTLQQSSAAARAKPERP